MKKTLDQRKLAGIEFHGSAGITESCLMAVSRIIHFGEVINKAHLLSCFDGSCGAHSLLLTVNEHTTIAIKSGFSSGYSGEGPRGLSTVLKMLIRHNVEIEEYEISSEFHERLDASCILNSDLDLLEKQRPIRPIRYYDYIDESRYPSGFSNNQLKQYFPPSINFGLLDKRLVDLALDFHKNSDHAINSAFRRLEDTIRNRTRLFDESGSKLFTKAFEGENSLLHWGDTNNGEHAGKANLFKAIFSVYRNPRAHQELSSNESESLREFMLINELFILEEKAYERVSS
jgi:uncharacterized protein (TIGR02391 family)